MTFMIDRTRIRVSTGDRFRNIVYKLGDITSPQNDEKLKTNEKLRSETGNKQHTEQRGKNCLSAKTSRATTDGDINGR
jgi:hypothetical protein